MNTKLPLLFLLAASLALAAETPTSPALAAACPHCPAAATETAQDGAASFTRESIYQLDDPFTDDSGHAFKLSELRGRPVVLDLFFASCGYACPLQVTDMQTLRGKLPSGVRDRAVFVLVSFDVDHDTPAELARYRAQRKLDGQWILLHGDNNAVRELAALVGVKYRQDADGTFSHSNILTILNPRGEMVHQRSGLQGGLDESAAALAAAAK